jgi:serine/threonine protein kinase
MTEPESPVIATKEPGFRGVLVPGTLLGNYEILSVLGQGGFGITYLARDSRLGRKVAIKEYLPASLAVREADTVVVPRSTAMAEEFVWGRDRFIDEARTLARLGGVPSIVPVYDFLEANGTAYMVMAFAEGETLSHRLKEGGGLSPGDTENMLHLLMDGLEQVHEAGFVHRDIKPDNIILDTHSHPTLIDFGASRAPVAGQTGAMTAIFTPGYGAAEQFTSGKQGPWTDIYGLSATLYHAISGKTPPSAFDRMLDDEYVSLVGLRPPGFSLALLAAIDQGMAVRAGQRPQSIPAWRELLAEGAAASDQTIVLPHQQRDPGQTVAMPSSRQRDANQTIASPSRQQPASTRPATEASQATSVPWKSRLESKLYVASGAIVLLLGGAGYLLWAPASPLQVGSAIQADKPPASGPVVAAAPVSPVEVTQMFDGKWSVHTICDDFKGAADFEHTYEMTVKDGAIYGEDGVKGAAGSGILTGRIAPTGQLNATYSGKNGEKRKYVVDAAPGSPVTYTVGGRVYDGRGMAKQTTQRPCAITFIEIEQPAAPAKEPAATK